MDAEALLDGLTEQQRRAVLALRGPVRILAGAGTGKTRTITRRIAYGLATGAYSPGRVLALTFTAKAAAELRDRLRALGSPEVPARTFHSAALAQLSHFWPMVIGGDLPEVLDGKSRLLAQAAERLGLGLPQAALRDVAAEIEWRKGAALGIDAYAALGRPVPSMLAPGQLIDLMAGYESLKDERRRLDFEDVLLATAGLLQEEPWALAQVREQYRVFVVDEYQDVSPLQQRLLELWLGTRRDLCVVGDASQTIYSFAGASAGPLLDFGRRFQDATLVSLSASHRSAPPLLELANALMAGRAGAVRLEPASPAASSTPTPASEPMAGRAPERPAPVPALRSFAHPTAIAEATAVAELLRAELDAGVAADRLAVLYRVHAQSPPLEAALAAAGVPFQVQGERRFFELPVVRRAVEQLRAAAVADPAAVPLEEAQVIARGLGWQQEPPRSGAAERAAWEALQAILDQAAAAPEGTSLREFAAALRAREAARAAPGREAVALSTLHAAKGLEWDSVQLIGLSEGLLPIEHAREESALDEERRLLYVGITRARHRLVLHWSAQALGRSARRRSRFLDGLGLEAEPE